MIVVKANAYWFSDTDTDFLFFVSIGSSAVRVVRKHVPVNNIYMQAWVSS